MKEILPISAFSMYEVLENNQVNDVVILKHELNVDDNGKLGLEVGVPVSIHEIIAKLKAVAQFDKNTNPLDGFLPKDIIYQANGWTGWHVLQHTTTLFFKNQKIVVPLPNLLMFSNGEDFYVCATKSSEIQPDMPIFHAPVSNIYKDGHVCWGSVNPPISLPEEVIKNKRAWREALLHSIGTELHHSCLTGIKNSKKGFSIDYLDFMVTLSKKSPPLFPEKNLSPMGETLSEFIKKF